MWPLELLSRHYMTKKNFTDCVRFYTPVWPYFLVISTLYPNGHNLRPYYFTHHNMFTALCEWLYSTDTPTNLFPSIHVYNSLGIHFAVMHSSYFKDKKHVQHASLVLCVLIILSTMFIKQHSVFDVSTAFMLAFVMYNVVYIKNWMHLPQKSGSFQDAANSKVRVWFNDCSFQLKKTSAGIYTGWCLFIFHS